MNKIYLIGSKEAPAFPVRLAAMAALYLSLLGCAVGPNYKVPPAPNTTGYMNGLPTETVQSDVKGGAAQTFEANHDIPGEWWTLFHSQQLNQLIVEALKNNPTLKASQAALREARENVYAQEGSFFPTIDGSGTAEREKSSSALFNFPGSPNVYNLYNASVNLSYTLDVFGGTRRQVEGLIAQRDYEAYELEASYLSLTSNIVTSAITVASLREQITRTQEIIKDLSAQLDISQKQFALGGISRADVLLQESNLRQEQATLPPLQLQLVETQNQLTTYTGHLPGDPQFNQFSLKELHLPLDLPVSLSSQIVNQRPDVQASAALLHQASANIGVAVANRLPQITLSGTLASEALQPGQLFTPGMGLWTIAAGVTQPIFEGGTLVHRQKASEAAFDQASAQYQSTVISAFQDVANVLSTLDYDAKTLKADLEAESSAAESLKIAEGQFKLGGIPYITVLNAQQTYEAAAITLVRARAARYADTAALFQSLGGGWWHRNDIQKQPSFIENPL